MTYTTIACNDHLTMVTILKKDNYITIIEIPDIIHIHDVLYNKIYQINEQ